MLRSRRRAHYGGQICAITAALLLLLSVSLLHTRLHFTTPLSHPSLPHSTTPLLPTPTTTSSLLLDNDADLNQYDDSEEETNDPSDVPGRVSGFYYDHVNGVVRRSIHNKNINEWEDYSPFNSNPLGLGFEDEKSKGVFGSDDIPVDESIRRKIGKVRSVEDLLMLKFVEVGGSKRVSPLREGWGDWFDKKSDFLRKDRTFKSNFENLNPLNNPLLQDPDGGGVTGLTRGDRMVQKVFLNEFRNVGKKSFGLLKDTRDLEPKRVSESEIGLVGGGGGGGNAMKVEKVGDNVEGVDEGRSEVKKAERRTLDDDVNNNGLGSNGINKVLNATRVGNLSLKSDRSEGIKEQKVKGKVVRTKSEVSGQVFADGKRWGYYPGVHPGLAFSNFMDAFFRKARCSMRIFMVWNSPPWMFGVRHQRGLESILFHHRDACVIVFSETIELNFFSGFVKEGFKVAVAMPNLDELLKDTPTHIFASVWFEWKKTKFYPTHYSELVRLAALYKYGGIYLDSDIVVLKPLSSLNNTVGLEDVLAGSPLNGAVMAFRKHSTFIKECLMEFYATYDDTRLRWNGADLLTRVARNFLVQANFTEKQMELKLQPSFVFFPISQNNITRYFSAPAMETERIQQDVLFKRILNESNTFHFWSSSTSAMVPEPESLVARVINKPCIHCSDVL